MMEQKQQADEMQEKKRIMLRQLMESDAMERLNRLRLVKPEKAGQVENIIIQRAQSGALQNKMADGDLMKILEKLDESAPKTSVKVVRKKRMDGSDSDVDLD